MLTVRPAVLKRDRTTFTIPAPRQRQTLPAILSREEVERVKN